MQKEKDAKNRKKTERKNKKVGNITEGQIRRKKRKRGEERNREGES